MKRWTLLMAAGVAALYSPGTGRADPIADELAMLKGKWVLVSGLRGGKPPPADRLGEFQFAFDGNKVTLTIGKLTTNGSFTIDPTKQPKHLDLTFDGTTALGLYEFQQDRLAIVFDEPGKDRPTRLESREGTKQTLVILKREK